MRKFEKNFNLVLISQSISLIGGAVLRFILLLFILDITLSAETFGMVNAITQIPAIAFALLGGIIADRMNKQRLIVVFDVCKTVLCFGLFIAFLGGNYSVTLITIFITLFMTIVTLFQPVLTAAVPSIVKQEVFVEANGAIQSINAISDILSFVLGGVLYATMNIQTIILLGGIFFLISTIIDAFIKIPFVKQEKSGGALKTMKADVKESYQYLKNKTPILFKTILVYSVIAMLFFPILTVALPYIIRVFFQMSDGLYGVSQAIAAFGMVLAGILAGKLKKWFGLEKFSTWISISGWLCFLIALSVYTPIYGSSYMLPFWISSITIMAVVVIISLLNISMLTLMQEEIPEHLLGKVFALVLMIANLLVPIGQFLFGLLMEGLGSQLFLIFIGIAIIVIVIAVISKKILKLS